MFESATKTKQPAAAKHQPAAAHLQFADIGNDMLVLKDGSARAVLEVTPICLAGYSDEEQTELMRRYAGFLNTLERPLQILLKSRALNIDGYMQDLKHREEEERRPVFRAVLKDYRGLLQKFLPYSGYGTMERSAYLVVAHELPKAAAAAPLGGIFSLFAQNKLLREMRAHSDRLRTLREGLDAEVAKVLAAFEPVGLPVRRLPTLELMRLFARQYHPGTRDSEHDALFRQFDSFPA
jgi:hypothetical protein